MGARHWAVLLALLTQACSQGDGSIIDGAAAVHGAPITATVAPIVARINSAWHPPFHASSRVRNAEFPRGTDGGTHAPAPGTLPLTVTDPVSHVGASVGMPDAVLVVPSVANGVTTWPNALGDADIRVHPTATGVEDFVVFHAAPPSRHVRYAVSLVGVAGVRVLEDTIELLDASGAPRVHMSPPSVSDANGVNAAAHVSVTGCAYDSSPVPPWGRAVTPPAASECMLDVSFDDDGLVYPVTLDPSWATTGSLAVARGGAPAVLLTDGRVLVSGGYGASGALASCELYDPTTSTWATTGSMGSARQFHAMSTAWLIIAVVVQRVVAAGGDDGSGNARSSAEFWNATTGTWAATGSLATAREGHTVTQLSDGRSLIVGGWNASGPIATTEAYSTVLGTFSSAGSLGAARMGHAATLLTTNKVLVSGGWGTSGLASAERWDPTTSTWSSAGTMSTLRESHAQNILSDGRVLVTGGDDATGAVFSSAELYNPTTNVWTTTTSLANARTGHTTVLRSDGTTLAIGGYTGSSYTATTEIFTLGTTTWASGGSMATARDDASAVVLGNTHTLVIGGGNASSVLSSCETF